MRSVGEVMAIGRTWQESIQKAIRQVDPSYNGFQGARFDDLDDELRNPTGMGLFKSIYAKVRLLTEIQRSSLACSWASFDARKLHC